MADEKKRARTGSRLQGDASLDLLAIQEGDIVGLRGGGTAEVVDNPRDGMWVLLRYLELPDDAEMVGEEELVFWADVAAPHE